MTDYTGVSTERPQPVSLHLTSRGLAATQPHLQEGESWLIPRYLKRTRTDSSLPGASAAEFCWPRGPATATGCTSTAGRITTAAQTVPGHPATSAGRRGRTADVTWLKTDDRFPEHRKIRRLTDAAYRLHHTAMCACAVDETDGLVTEADLADMEHGQRLRKHIDALVSAGLWEPVKDGWLIHDFLDYNPHTRRW